MLIDAEAELIPVLTPVITTTTGSSIMGASSSLDNGNGRGRVQPNLFTCPQCGYCAGIIYLGAEYSPSIGQTGEMTTLVTQSLFLESQAVRGDRGVCKIVKCRIPTVDSTSQKIYFQSHRIGSRLRTSRLCMCVT